MKTSITDFQRNFRKAREAADRGDPVIGTGENGDYVFERRASVSDSSFEGLEGIFGAVTLEQEKPQSVKKSASALAKRTVIVDGGPLKAAIDARGVDHEWAVKALSAVRGHFVTCEAAITEAQHGSREPSQGLRALRPLVARMDVISVAAEFLGPVFDEAET